MATHYLPTTKARSHFLSMVRDAGEALARYVITHRGKPEAVLISFEEYEGWMETMEVSQSASWRQALAQARREDKTGRRLSYESVVGKKQKISKAR